LNGDRCFLFHLLAHLNAQLKHPMMAKCLVMGVPLSITKPQISWTCIMALSQFWVGKWYAFKTQVWNPIKTFMTKILKIQYLPHLRSKNLWNHFYATFSMWIFNNANNMSQFPCLYMKENCLFVCFVSHVEISQTMVPPAMFLVMLESPQQIKVHGVGFIMFWFIMQKSLNIEFFFH